MVAMSVLVHGDLADGEGARPVCDAGTDTGSGDRLRSCARRRCRDLASRAERDDLVQDVLAQYFDEVSRFVAAVKRGDASLRCGEYVTREEVGERLKRFLQISFSATLPFRSPPVLQPSGENPLGGGPKINSTWRIGGEGPEVRIRRGRHVRGHLQADW